MAASADNRFNFVTLCLSCFWWGTLLT